LGNIRFGADAVDIVSSEALVNATKMFRCRAEKVFAADRGPEPSRLELRDEILSKRIWPILLCMLNLVLKGKCSRATQKSLDQPHGKGAMLVGSGLLLFI
jgi:hypothetical protein